MCDVADIHDSRWPPPTIRAVAILDIVQTTKCCYNAAASQQRTPDITHDTHTAVEDTIPS